MPTGELKIWNADRGYGFLSQDGATNLPDMFVHVSAFQLAGLEPELGDVYSYAIGSRNEKPLATHLTRVWSPRDEAVDANR